MRISTCTDVSPRPAYPLSAPSFSGSVWALTLDYSGSRSTNCAPTTATAASMGALWWVTIVVLSHPPRRAREMVMLVWEHRDNVRLFWVGGGSVRFEITSFAHPTPYFQLWESVRVMCIPALRQMVLYPDGFSNQTLQLPYRSTYLCFPANTFPKTIHPHHNLRLQRPLRPVGICRFVSEPGASGLLIGRDCRCLVGFWFPFTLLGG